MLPPFSLGLRLFVAMTAGHVLLEVFANFIVQSSSAGAAIGLPVGLASMALMIGISALELLVAVIQAYVFALLTRSEEHTSELQSLMRISYAVFCLKKKKPKT